jgi:hypothetical protein
MNKWQKVYSTPNYWQAEIVKATLDENSLFPVLIDKRDTAYNQSFGGECEIYVEPQYVISALKIIQNDIIFQ